MTVKESRIILKERSMKHFIPVPHRYGRAKRVDPLDWVIIVIALTALAVAGAALIVSIKEAL